MPKLIIDDITVEVAEGISVLEAAKTVGITIPHFCWHPALGRAGACRVCAVKVVDGPQKGLQMSCMLTVQEGMVVSTTDSEAMALRRQVIEWLMLNHPHDCPVCDEGGECQLQDFTIAGGHGIRRFSGPKRTYLNQYLGPNIEQEMNRCIQCYRCARFYQEYAGGRDFGVLGSAGRVCFGRFNDGALDSPFSGNLTDVCPTGVFTDKAARFRARYWDYDMAPSVCPECSLGCNIIPVARYRELLKVKARHNAAVNGWFICDQGRFAEKTVNSPQRPRQVLVDGAAATWSEALAKLAARIGVLPPGSIALVGSSRLALEGAALLAQLAQALPAGSLSYFLKESEASAAVAAVAGLTATNSASLKDLAAADCVVIYECDLRAVAPMMLLAVRQAWRSGAPVLLVGKGATLEQAMAVSIEAVDIEFVEEAPLGIFDRPVIIFDAASCSAAEIDYLFRAEASFAPVFAGANGCGAALLGVMYNTVSLEAALSSGKIKAIIAVEADIPATWAADIPVIAALDWQKTPAIDRAEIVLPTRSWLEMDGTFINNEGRAQRFRRLMEPGIPVKELLEDGHPPRRHLLEQPGGDLREAWCIVADLLRLLAPEFGREPFSGIWGGLRDLDPEGEGMVVLP